MLFKKITRGRQEGGSITDLALFRMLYEHYFSHNKRGDKLGQDLWAQYHFRTMRVPDSRLFSPVLLTATSLVPNNNNYNSGGQRCAFN